MIIIVFYFLLRIGEYTAKTRRKKKTPTRQFRKQDATFFTKNKEGNMLALPRTASDESILNADAATMQISNQNNGSTDACVHHTAIPNAGLLCPIKALAQRVIHIRMSAPTGTILATRMLLAATFVTQ